MRVKHIYSKYGFVVNFINSEIKLETLRDDFPRVYFNIKAADEHVPEAEQKIRVVKKRTRSVQHTLPFRKIPVKTIIRMVNFSVFWLKHFPVSTGVGGNLSPITIATGRTIDFGVKCKLEFGAYSQVHNCIKPRNSGEARTLGADCLCPSGNMRVGYKLLSLTTGEILHRFSWT